ncbi:endoplasmic reticulum metallopeptidase 1-like isoform X2 [Eupeodes corollae]|uniref:endoplasmic reticulum metallopeptidase 1-like isoform X2 n=1 Tax=Eupeodes corollae TaxID=290404 RepID=UPI0024917DF2|nr:endoplasmic reticulum metallopeptidase 1-like isoform X2 [Eupeodes corollae]XP_055918141.1 endoplasmic reticulum metallopeptidase 1-like isoform X2 [Eupeodes corollae]XP_055918142.1 endoplasmic reticulum metallopeptidase 1-like isoform X2 [Eupeodes corollae]XP_055918143.1 endoplasmic reticulum metallopeptidase 1-like isoform X2 [Eupeodes corollae]XP_055918144.1 endoplasmic reticulum metallopeptidase 1-like isoform X2 [Eupeodes corollae]XP_055918145.1 endoplasmic reticulum metallopeptidase 1
MNSTKYKKVAIKPAVECEGEMRYSRVSTGSKRKSRRVGWYWALPYLGFWVLLYFAVVLPIYRHLPEALTIQDEHIHPDRFIAERAEQILAKLEAIGPKVVGSNANEVEAVNLIVGEVEKIKKIMNKELFTLDLDIQEVSGAYILGDMVNMYQGLQNIVVKFASNYSNSSSYLLINTHFDSKPGSPGSGDAGVMVAVMLEVIRVLAVGRQTFDHPIVFVFNGGEENPLQASHGFITQHKWAKNCKALINLDSSGSGHRELLFQTGPNNPWLLKYYKQHAIHPFANTIAEELFQANVIPSDTDFRIFKNFGHVPGLDMAHTYNGYVYHTKFDRMSIIPQETIQNTGDNVLSLAKAFANAPELEDPSIYAKGHTVFYDIFGKFLIYYTESQAEQINYVLSALTLLAIVCSLWGMAKVGEVSFGNILGTFFCVFCVHVIAFVLAVGLPILLAVGLDLLGLSMTWFTSKWMIIGLYGCPTLVGLGIPTAIYIGSSKDKLNISFKTQMVMHSQCILLTILTCVGTYFGIRSSYLLMIAVLFYFIPLVVNMVSCLFQRGYQWALLVFACQIPAFMCITYMSCIFFMSLIPMMGRFGSKYNPDLIIGGVASITTLLAMGYIIPMVNLFRKSLIIIASLLVITAVFLVLTVTPIGFPFREETNVERFHLQHIRRLFHEADSTISRNDSGYYFDLQDRRQFNHIKDVFDTSKLADMSEECNKHIFCGFPVFNHRWNRNKVLSQWLPSDDYLIPGSPKLTLVSKNVTLNSSSTVRYDFELTGPSHMGIYLNPLNRSKIIEWSFLNTMLEDKWNPPYFIYFSMGKDKSPLAFYVVLETPTYADETNSTIPILELGIGGHYVSFEHTRSLANKAFIQSFPSYAYVMEWPSSYERWIY